MRAPAPRPLLAALLGVALLLGVGVLAVGCDVIDGDDGEIGTGEFRARVTGDVDSSFGGDAYWSVINNGSGDTFVLLFFDDELRSNHRDDYAFVALSRQGGAPGVGAFAVANDEPNPPAFRGQYANLEEADEPDATGPVLSATDGVLTVTRVQSGLINGSFRFDARGLQLPSTSAFITGTVQGTFEARYLSPATIGSLNIPFGLD